MDRALVAGLLAVFTIWVGAAAYTSSRLVVNNWPLFRTWRRQDRETRVRLSLWLAIPLMKVGLFLFAAHGLWSMLNGHRVSDVMAIRALIVLPMVMTSVALMLFYIYARSAGPEAGGRIWRWMVLIGFAAGAAVFAATWAL